VYLIADLVAPHAGAWIETKEKSAVVLQNRSSHPTRVRGLKQAPSSDAQITLASHPTRVRGLKQILSRLAK